MNKEQVRQLIKAHLEEGETECKWCFTVDMQRIEGKAIATYNYPDSILAEAPKKEEQTRQNLIAAYRDIRASAELKRVIRSTMALQRAEEKIKPVNRGHIAFRFHIGSMQCIPALGIINNYRGNL